MSKPQPNQTLTRFLTRAVAWMPVALVSGSPSAAQTLRVYSNTVVTSEVVRLRDVASGDLPTTLLHTVLAEAPPPGGARPLHVDLIRQALRDGGANLASVRVSGATECIVSRPVELRQNPETSTVLTSGTRPPVGAFAEAATEASTLRSYIEVQASTELARYGGRAVLSFDGDAQAFLDLTSPPLAFRLVRRTGAVPGLTTFEIEVSQDGRVLQTLSLKANVAMTRDAVVASRPILKGTIVLPEDVRVETIQARSVQQPLTGDPRMVVGRRAERFFAEGEPLDPQQIRSVPIVSRQQMVRVVARVGGVRLESVGQALEDAVGGQLVRVKLVDRAEESLTGVATSPGVVMIGDAPVAETGADPPPPPEASKPEIPARRTGA